MAHNVPWYIPNLDGEGKVLGYTGPFANAEDRDAYAKAYMGPSTLGTPFQAVSNPNETLPCVVAVVAARDGTKLHWSDGTITDA